MGNGHLIAWLEAFNRKERYYLISQALGGFSLDRAFRDLLGRTLGFEIPSHGSAWMDYHLDWVFAALTLANLSPDEAADRVFESPNFSGGDPLLSTKPVHVNSNQEDIDLLVAFRDGEVTRLVFLEAKGETSWSNRQLGSKVRRLATIFAGAGHGLSLSFVLCSPRPPVRMKIPEGCPDWVAPGGTWRWMQLAVPAGRREIERWDGPGGVPSESATTWRVRPLSTSREVRP